MRRLWGLLFVLVLLWPDLADADKMVTAKVDRKNLTLEDTLNLTVSVKSRQGAKVDVSLLKDFQVTSRGSSSNISIVNGRISEETAYHFLLSPRREGQLTVGPLLVLVGDKTYQTQSIQVRVGSPDKNRKTRDLFIETSISHKQPYEGQEIIYQLKIYLAARIANARLSAPDFGQLSAKELPDRRNYVTQLNGRRFKVTVISYLLKPIKPGRMTIGPAELFLDLVHSNDRPGFFSPRSLLDDPFFSRGQLESKVIRGRAIELLIRSRPPYDRPEPFSGLVGSFDLTAELADREVEAGQSATFSLTVSGAGNIKDAGPPSFEAPAGLKLYADTPEEEIELTENGFTGKKVFRYALVALEQGEFILPSATLTYLDPDQGGYVTRRTEPVSIKVRPPAAPEKTADQALTLMTSGQADRQKVEILKHDILPLKDEPDVLSDQSPWSPLLFLLLSLLPALAYLGAGLVFKLTGQTKTPDKLMAQEAVEAIELAARASDRQEALSYLSKALICAVNARGKRLGRSLTYDEVETILDQHSADSLAPAQVAELLARIDSARYGQLRSDQNAWEDVFQETRQVVKELCP